MHCNVWRDKNLCATNLCDQCLTRIIHINKTRASKCRFTVPLSSVNLVCSCTLGILTIAHLYFNVHFLHIGIFHCNYVCTTYVMYFYVFYSECGYAVPDQENEEVKFAYQKLQALVSC